MGTTRLMMDMRIDMIKDKDNVSKDGTTLDSPSMNLTADVVPS